MRVFQIAKWPMPRTRNDKETRRRFYCRLLSFGGRHSLWIGLYFIEINLTTYRDPAVGQKLWEDRH